jgi:hypothetical protein
MCYWGDTFWGRVARVRAVWLGTPRARGILDAESRPAQAGRRCCWTEDTTGRGLVLPRGMRVLRGEKFWQLGQPRWAAVEGGGGKQ